MAFTVGSARDRAELLIDEEIADTDAISWANEFIQKKVDKEHWPEVSDTTTYAAAAANTWYALPTTFVSVIEVLGSNGGEYTDYEIRSKKIKFGTAGAYTLTHRTTHTALAATTGATGTPAIHDLFELPMSKFMASRQRSKDDSEDPDAMRWLADCEDDLAKLFVNVQTQEEPPRVAGRW